jgi:alkylation response protein AidB-like acyl-CoA dehydrogenase
VNPAPALDVFAAGFREWLTTSRSELAELLDPGSDFDVRVVKARELRGLLWRSGWGRYGWAPEMGGLAGTVLHRAVVTEELYRAGWTGPTVFEHIEIIGPTLVQYAQPEFAALVVPEFISGAHVWAQGFSEPEAG